MLLRILIASIAASILLVCSAEAATLKVQGSTTVARNLILPKQAEIEKASGQTLQIVANGSGRCVLALVSGEADMAMISAPLDVTVENLNKAKPGSVDGGALKAHQIGHTEVGFMAHPSNSVKKLTLAQITDVLSGKIGNWKDLGGQDAPIVIVCETKGGGVRSMTEEKLLEGKSIAGAPRELPSATQVSKVASQLPNAFGIGVRAGADSTVALILTDQPIVQPLILVTKGDPTPEMAQVIAAAKGQAGS